MPPSLSSRGFALAAAPSVARRPLLSAVEVTSQHERAPAIVLDAPASSPLTSSSAEMGSSLAVDRATASPKCKVFFPDQVRGSVVGLDDYGFRGGFSGPRARLLAGRERRGSRRGLQIRGLPCTTIRISKCQFTK